MKFISVELPIASASLSAPLKYDPLYIGINIEFGLELIT
jgi:hypothetical protein